MFCPSCGREEPDNPIYCRGCGHKLPDDTTQQVMLVLPQAVPNQPAPPQPAVRVNRAGRVLCGIYGVWTILGVITGLTYFAESHLISEFVVDMICLVAALACLAIAFVPELISRKLKIKLENGGVLAAAVVVLVLVSMIATMLGPEPPGGWWNYGG